MGRISHLLNRQAYHKRAAGTFAAGAMPTSLVDVATIPYRRFDSSSGRGDVIVAGQDQANVTATGYTEPDSGVERGDYLVDVEDGRALRVLATDRPSIGIYLGVACEDVQFPALVGV